MQIFRKSLYFITSKYRNTGIMVNNSDWRKSKILQTNKASNEYPLEITDLLNKWKINLSSAASFSFIENFILRQNNSISLYK